jgi:TRAP-type C4-dicarboxylate transport system substrate-binding protein
MESPLYIATFVALGASPLPMAWSEVYTALQQGTIDAHELAFTGASTNKMEGVTPNITESNQIYSAAVMCFSQQLWDKQSPDDQKRIDAASDKACFESREIYTKMNNEAVEYLKSHDCTIYPINIEEWRPLVQPVYDKYAKDIGLDLIKKIEDLEK